MNKASMAYAALALSVLACVLAVVALLGSSAQPSRAAAAPQTDAAGIQQLADDWAQARNELERLMEAARAGAASQESVERTPAQPSVSPELTSRLAALEQSVASLQQQVQERAPAAKPPEAKPSVEDARRIATDLRASEQERLAALQALRSKMVDGRDARTSDVVLAMLDLAERSQDENTRNDVYRNLHGVNDNALRDSMLRALASDPSAKVRERAARDIDTFLADALVQSALRGAADNDADASVRSAALKTLASKR